MLVFCKGNKKQPHLIVDSLGKYYGLYPSLESARSVVEEIMRGEHPPPITYIYKAEIIDTNINEPPLEITEYNPQP